MPQQFLPVSTWTTQPTLKLQELPSHALCPQGTGLKPEFEVWTPTIGKWSQHQHWQPGLSTSHCAGMKGIEIPDQTHFLSCCFYESQSWKPNTHKHSPTSPCSLPWHILELAWASNIFKELFRFCFFFFFFFIYPFSQPFFHRKL